MDDLTSNMSSMPAGEYRKWMEDLKREREERRREIEHLMDQEKEVRLKNIKEEVIKKWT